MRDRSGSARAGRGAARRYAARCYGRGAALLALALLVGCGGGRATADRPSGTPPLRLDGQRVLVLPVQVDPGADLDRQAFDGELLFALQERGGTVTWVGPEELRRALRRAPAFAADPGALPPDPLLRHGERYAIEPLAGQVRRYSALVDARLVLLPRLLGADTSAAAPRLTAALLDSRSGAVVWWTEVVGGDAPLAGRAALATFSATVARRLLAHAGERGEP